MQGMYHMQVSEQKEDSLADPMYAAVGFILSGVLDVNTINTFLMQGKFVGIVLVVHTCFAHHCCSYLWVCCVLNQLEKESLEKV